ncbi:MAG: hypothetical protein FWE05_07075 [Defluviitaleaceae bacterium]|nr:hypothetical protein [Defluviitaleaceae bacterium]
MASRIGFTIGKYTNFVLGIGLIVFGIVVVMNRNIWGIASCIAGIATITNGLIAYRRRA